MNKKSRNVNSNNHIRLFDWIAPAYALFFGYQVHKYRQQIKLRPELNHGSPLTIIDIGSGTGALAYVLAEQGHRVIGMDGSLRMTQVARRLNRWAKKRATHKASKTMKATKTTLTLPSFVQVNILKPEISLADIVEQNSQAINAEHPPKIDLIITSFVLHGLDAQQRSIIFRKIKLAAPDKLLILDYSPLRSLVTDVVEWLEGGDYFNFVRTIHTELSEQFPTVEVYPVHRQLNWYVLDI
ncbi:MAG: class I SAM-dependent methyltransferase [Eubacteriales bacterium]|nr:class I SAM-dependent methyltransferase [Eubacteriales bacterium]